MEAPIIKTPTDTRWLIYATIAAVVLLIAFLFWRNSKDKKLLKALQKKNAVLVGALSAAAEAVDVISKSTSDPVGSATEPLEKKPSSEVATVQVVEMEAEADIVTAKDMPSPSTNPVIPASLKYRIQPLEGEYSFNAISSKPNGLRVFCNLETIGLSEERELVFRVMQGNNLVDTKSRMWPIEGKEIGTILTNLLNP